MPLEKTGRHVADVAPPFRPPSGWRFRGPVGVASNPRSTYRTYWAQDFGRG